MKTLIRLEALVLAVALLLPGCFFSDETGAADILLLEKCESHSDCDGELVCDLKVGVCVKDEAVKLSAWFRLKPPPKGVLAVEEHYAAMEVSSEQDVQLTLHRPIRVIGRVLLEDNPLMSQEASIVAVALGTIPDLNIYEDANATQGHFDYENGMTEQPGFEFLVAEGVVYDIFVRLAAGTDGAERPPYHVRRSFGKSDMSQDPFAYEWDITVPGEGSYVHLIGCVWTEGEEMVPVVGAEVRAVASESGNESTASVTDEDGCFDVAVQPLVALVPETYELRLKGTYVNPLIPSMTLTEVEVTQSVEMDKLVDLGELMIPPVGELREYEVVISAAVDTSRAEDLWAKNATEYARELAEELASELTEELVGTQVLLAGQFAEGTLRLDFEVAEATTEIDEEVGLVTVTVRHTFELPPGSYAVNVVPEFHSRFGIHQQVVSVGLEAQVPPEPSLPGEPADGDDSTGLANIILVELTEKAEMTIQVVAPDGLALHDARVEARRIDKGKYPLSLPLKPRNFLAEPDPAVDGAYTMHLDPGNYSFVIDAPVDSGLPRKVVRDFTVSGNATTTQFQLSQPTIVTGHVLGTVVPEAVELSGDDDGDGDEPSEQFPGEPDAKPVPYEANVAGVKVELFDEAEGLGEADAIAPIPIAEGYTADDGRFVLIIPAD